MLDCDLRKWKLAASRKYVTLLGILKMKRKELHNYLGESK